MLKKWLKITFIENYGVSRVVKILYFTEKIRKTDKIFFENFEKFDISCGFWVSDKYNNIDYKLLQR